MIQKIWSKSKCIYVNDNSRFPTNILNSTKYDQICIEEGPFGNEFSEKWIKLFIKTAWMLDKKRVLKLQLKPVKQNSTISK